MVVWGIYGEGYVFRRCTPVPRVTSELQIEVFFKTLRRWQEGRVWVREGRI
jgi:hypothetical protein